MGRSFSIFCPGMLPLDVFTEFSGQRGGVPLLKKTVHEDSSCHQQELMPHQEDAFCSFSDERLETGSRASDDVQLLSESFTDESALQHLLPPPQKDWIGEQNERVSRCSRSRNILKSEHLSNNCTGYCPAKKPTSGLEFHKHGAVDLSASEAVFELTRSKRPNRMSDVNSTSKLSPVSETVSAHPKAHSFLRYKGLVNRSDSIGFNDSLCSEWPGNDGTDSIFYNPATTCDADDAVKTQDVHACDRLELVFNCTIEEAPFQKTCCLVDETDKVDLPSAGGKNHVCEGTRDSALMIWPGEVNIQSGSVCKDSSNSDMAGGSQVLQPAPNTTSEHLNVCSTTCCEESVFNCQTKTSNSEQDHKVISPSSISFTSHG